MKQSLKKFIWNKKIKEARLTLKHRLFLLERKIECTPILKKLYPRRKFYLRVASVILMLPVIIGGYFYFFQPESISANWYNSSWKYRKAITINSSKVTATQTNFPVLVSFESDEDLVGNVQEDFDDIMFTDAAGTQLDHEIEFYATASGQLQAWVKVPTLSSTTDTTLYMYYGNPTATNQQDPTNVWDSNYKGVWHLKEDPTGTSPQMKDSTGVNNGTTSGMAGTDWIDGVIHKALNFDDSNNIVNAGNNSSLNITNATLTLNAWVRRNVSNEQGVIAGRGTAATNGYVIGIGNGQGSGCTTNQIYMLKPGVNSSCMGSFPADTNWHHVVVVTSSNGQITYIDGATSGTSANGSNMNTSTNDFRMGTGLDGASILNADLDEVRFSNTNRSTSWIETEWNNQATPSAFLTASDVQDQTDPVLHWKFDEGSGTSAYDASGNSKTGTLTNSPTWKNKDLCLFGTSCLYFDGTNDQVKRTYSSDNLLDPGPNDFSVSAWFSHPGAVSGTDTLIARSNGAVNGIGYKIYMNSSGQVCFGIDDDAASFPDDSVCSYAAKTYTDSQWHHVEAVKSGTSTITLYIDGKQAAPTTTVTATGDLSGSSPAFYVGIDGDGSSNPWAGFIDDVKVFDYAQTASQVKATYAAKGSTGGASATLGMIDAARSLSQGLIGYWKLDETAANSCLGGSNDACDSSGNNGDGAWNGNTTNWPGKFGMGGRFDGSGDFVSVVDTATLSATTKLSISAWASPSAGITSKALVVKNNSYRMVTNGNGNPQCQIHDGSSWQTAASSSAALSLLSWQNVVCTYDQKSIKVYVDGDLKGQAAVTTGIADTVNNLRIGSDQGGTYNDYNGNMDDVRVYNRALSGMEAQRLYDYGVSPVSYWNFDERTGTVVYDRSGGGKNLDFPEAGVAPTSVNEQIAAATDDAEEFNSDTDVNNASSDLELTYDASPATTQTVGLRFQTVNIPQGAFITSAILRFTEDNSGGDVGSPNYTITAQDADDTVTFANNLGDISSRPKTTASAAWSPGAWGPGTHDTSDFSSVVQEVVDRGGWAANNNMVIFVDCSNCSATINRNAESYDGVPASAAQLLIEYATETVPDGPKWSSGKYGSGLYFDGSKYLTYGDHTDHDFSQHDSFTLEAWIKHGVQSSGQDIILGKEESTGADGGWKLLMESDGDITCGVDTDNASFPLDSVTSTAATYDDNAWHHVACVKDTSQTLRLYIDGVLIGTDSTLSTAGSYANDDALYIGIDGDASSNGWVGSLDDIRIYRYAKTAKQIVSSMNADHPAVGSPIGSALLHLKFDDGFGTVASNSGSLGSTANGNINSMASPAIAGSGWTKEGKFGNALRFDGSNDNVDVSGIATSLQTGDISVSVWFRPATTFSSANTTTQDLFSLSTSVSSNDIALSLDESDGRLRILAYDSGVITRTARSVNRNSWDANVWHHAVGIFSGTTGKISLYVDGKLTDSATTSTGARSATYSTLAFIGKSWAGNYFNGTIDEVKVYNYALNANEVRLDFNQGKGVVLGSLSTDPDGRTASNAASRAYCPPGDNQGGCAGGVADYAGPVGEWNFDERKGVLAQDISGNANTGVLTNEPLWAAGRIGSGIRFDGADDVVNAGSGGSLDELPAGGMSIDAWIYPTGMGEGGAGFIMAKNNGATVNAGWFFQLSGTNALNFTVDGSTDLVRTTISNAVTLNKWNHVAVSWDGVITTASSVRIYVNGIEQQYATTTNGAGIVADAASSFFIGNESGGTRTFSGVIDHPRVYTYARTLSQVQWDFNRGQPTNWWKFDECTGDRLYSSVRTASGSASGAIGTWSGASGGNTAIGACNDGNSAHAWYNGRTGKFSSSLDFDGADDVVQINNEPAIDMNDGIASGSAISVWVYAESDGESDVGRIFTKGANTWCRTDSESGGKVDLQCSLDLVSSDATINIGHAFTTNAWHNVVMTWADDADDEISIYIDGKLRGTSNDGSGSTIYADANNLFIGGNGAGTANTAAFDGKIDELMIFSYELTATQIRTLYNQFSAVRFGPLQGSP